LSVSRQVNSLFQTEFSKECDLELPPSTSKKKRDFLKLKAQRTAANREGIRKERDGIKLATQKLQVRCKDGALLEKELNFLRVLCENIKKERNTFILKLQRTAANREAIKERDSLKRQIENLRAQYNDAALLENELNTVRAQCDIIKKERDSLKLKAQRTAANREAIKKEKISEPNITTLRY
jgi:hypothetical protein